MDPGGAIEVTVKTVPADAGIVVVSGDSLVFDSSNYRQPQTVTLSATPDGDFLPEGVSVCVGAEGLPPTCKTVAVAADVGSVLFVNDDAGPAGKGTSWEDAFTNLQDALRVAASSGQVTEIRVAQGVYKPTGPTGDREATFQLINGVVVRGGYAGLGHVDPDVRDFEVYETVLSGDLNRDDRSGTDPCDLLAEPTRSDNSFHVVTGSGTDATAVLDGFTVTAGNANAHANEVMPLPDRRGFGAGLFNNSGSPTVTNCTFTNNTARYDGGAIYSLNEPYINERYTATARLINCAFHGNAAFRGGGGIRARADTALINCVFSGNWAGDAGGAVECGWGNLICVNCTLAGNTAKQYGGGIRFASTGSSASLVLTNSILWGNKAAAGQQVRVQGDVVVGISYNDIQDGLSGLNFVDSTRFRWGDGNINADPCFVDMDGADNTLGTKDDNLLLQGGSPCIDVGNNTLDVETNISGMPLPLGVDADLNMRRADDPCSVDLRSRDSAIIDMGAYEFNSQPIPPVLCVNDDAEGAKTGVNWQDAFSDLQMALQTASVASGKVEQIWVAAGTYTPTPRRGDRAAAFRLINGLAIHGGFAGAESTLDQRDLIANITLLSGDLKQDDTDLTHAPGGSYSINKGDNSYHVVAASYTDSTAILDGFTISAGNADLLDGVNDRGAGLFITFGSPTITNCTFSRNLAEWGSGLYCEQSFPTLAGCTIAENAAMQRGAGLYCCLSTPTVHNCLIRDNTPDGAYIENSTIQIKGTNHIASNPCTVWETALEGKGTLEILSDVALDLDDSNIRCNITGPGAIRVKLGSELIVEGDALIDLGHETDPNGLIQCDGLLRVKDEAMLANAQVDVTRASFEDNAIIANCVFSAEAGAPYGQFFIEDNVQLWLDRIQAGGDRYLDLDPRVFDCNNIHVDEIEVHITEGIGGAQGGLFELRGKALEMSPCAPEVFFCPVDQVPAFAPETWTIDRLELIPGSKLNLTNRFDFQAPYDLEGDNEVLFVRELILGPDSVLNTAFNHVYYENLIMDPTAQVVNVPLLGFSLKNIAFDDENDFRTRVVHNNRVDPDNPDISRIHIERVEGYALDPNGVMVMRNLKDTDPNSPSYGQTIRARAKGLFAKSSEEMIQIRFEYLFDCADEAGELVIYLSDTPELLGHSDPLRDLHYLEVARLFHPPSGRPGSAGSHTWGIFDQVVSREHLDFIRGTRVEFELIGAQGSCVIINNWDPGILCTSTYCGNVAGAPHLVNAMDFLAVLSECGRRITEVPAPGVYGAGCLDGFFCADGFVTIHDALAVDWASQKKNLCPDESLVADLGPSLYAHAALPQLHELSTRQVGISPPAYLANIPGTFLVAGKRYQHHDEDIDDFLSDRLYGLSSSGDIVGDSLSLDQDRLNGKLVRDHWGGLYQLNLELGLISLADGTQVVGPGSLSVENEYGQPVGVFLGFQQQGEAAWGRPLLDAAFDAQGYAYVVPVVVAADNGFPYLAAAKLQLGAGHTSPDYSVVQIFGDPPLENDNQDTTQLREIEVDTNGNVYVLNSHCDNNSDILWMYDSSGQILQRRELRDMGISAPVGLCISTFDPSRLYLSSAENQPDANNVTVYVLSTNDHLSLSQVIDVSNMGHITDMAEDPVSGTVYAVGFRMPVIPTQSEMQEWVILNNQPFYEACLAIIPYGSQESVAVCLSSLAAPVDHDLALPLSIVWKGGSGTGR